MQFLLIPIVWILIGLIGICMWGLWEVIGIPVLRVFYLLGVLCWSGILFVTFLFWRKWGYIP